MKLRHVMRKTNIKYSKCAENNFMEHDYRKLYEELSQSFWKLQQVPQTQEEQAYESLIQELESMTKNFQTEIAELESKNSEIKSSIDSISEIRQQYESLKNRERELRELQREVDSYYF